MARGFSFAVFILIALSIVYFSHYFIYFSVVHFFSVHNLWRRVELAIALFLLPTSFIASSFLAHRAETPLFKVLYFSSGLWLGVALTLITFFAFAWAAWGGAKLLGHQPNGAVFGLVAVALAGLYSAYGVWNAFHPRKEDVFVKIKNLPPDWRGKKVVQISDVHLGHILGSKFLQRLVEKTNAEEPAIVFITGDLFDGADGRLDELVAPFDNLKAPWGVYYVTGNHETYLGTQRALEAVRKTKAKILNDEMVTIQGVQVIGVSYPERGNHKNVGEVARKISNFNPHMPSILLYHNPTQVEQIKAAGINLQLSGHTHKGQIFPIQLISRLVYDKYYTGLHVEGDYTLYTTTGVGVWGPTMRTGNHPEIAVIHLE